MSDKVVNKSKDDFSDLPYPSCHNGFVSKTYLDKNNMIYCRDRQLLVNEYLGNRVRKFLPSPNPDTNTSLRASSMINDNDTIKIQKCMNKIKHHSASNDSIDICNINNIGNDTDDESSNTFRFELDSHANTPIPAPRRAT